MNKPLVLITGASGFIGTKLVSYLLKQDYKVIGLSRDKNKISNHPCLEWIQSFDQLKTDKIDYVINIAGESIGHGRWSDVRKTKLIQSRVDITEQLYTYLRKRNITPKRIISGSAVGYYGIDTDEKWLEVCTEESLPQHIFMSELCQKWEAVTQQYPEQNTKIIRLGVVLGLGGGILPQMLLPIRLNLVGRIGSGMQPCVWIHIEDVIKAIEFLMLKETNTAIFNVVAPERVNQKMFSGLAALMLKKKPVLNLPKGLFQFLLGEQSQLILNGQYVKPKALLDAGFEFKYPTLKQALKDLLAP